jgi:hypothetical protein
MRTSAAVQFLEGDEADECDCPACLPACKRNGRKCFIVCDRCREKFESDEIGPLKSVTRRVHYTSTTITSKVVDVSQEHRELMHLLKIMEAQPRC